MERISHAAVSRPLSFAVAAVRELKKIAQAVAKALGEMGEPEPFLTTLGPLLSDVESHLEALGHAGCPKGSDTEKRLLRLLAVLETLVRASRPRLVCLSASRS